MVSYMSKLPVFIVSLCYLLIPCSFKAVIVQFDHLKLGDRNVYILFEHHARATEIDSIQLDSLSEILKSRISCNPNPLHVMVEFPHLIEVPGYPIPPKGTTVTDGIIDRVNAFEETKVRAEDIEIRFHSGAAGYLLNGRSIETGMLNERLHRGALYCDVRDIDFRAILSEFSEQKRELVSFFEPMQKRFSVLDNKLQALDHNERDFHECITDITSAGCRENDSLVYILGRLRYSKEGLFKLSRLKDNIEEISVDLFDLHIAHKLLLDLKTSDVMIVAGAAHARWLCKLLESLDASYKTVIGDKFGTLTGEQFSCLISPAVLNS